MTPKLPVLPTDLSGAVPISSHIPVRVFPCFRARDPGAPPLIDLSRVVLEGNRKSFVGLDRYAAGDLLRPILAKYGLRGGADLTAQLRHAEEAERGAVGSRSFRKAVGTHVLLEHALHRLRAHLKVVDETFVLLPAPTLGPLPPAIAAITTLPTASYCCGAGDDAVLELEAEEDPAPSPSTLSPSGSQAGATTPAETQFQEEATVTARTQQPFSIAKRKEVEEKEPSSISATEKEDVQLDNRCDSEVTENQNSRRSSGSQAGATTPPTETTSQEEATATARTQQPFSIAKRKEVEEKEPSSISATEDEDLQLDNPCHSETEHIAADGYGFDYVMVFKAEEPGVMTEYADKAIRQIIAAGLTVRVYFSLSARDIFCEMRAPVGRLRQFADQVQRRLLLDETELTKTAVAGDAEANIAPIMINDDPDISFRSPYEFIYAKYDRSPHLQNLYFKSDGLSHPFRSVVRLSLVIDILKTPMYQGGAGLKVDKLQFEGKISALFPKHFEQNKNRLRSNWLQLKQWPWEAPFDEIKEYYGEKIGLYFHFLGHLTTWLLPLAVAGLVTAMTVYITGREEHPITLVFAPIVVFWAIIMLEFWKRKEQRIALEWGMAGFETAEQARPEYTGEFIPSPVDGSTILYYPASRKKSKARRATLVIMSMILIVVSCIAGVYAFRWYLVYGATTSGNWGETYGGVISSIVNAIQIQFLNAVYKKIAVALTDFENHRTSTEYEDSLVTKLFSFTFCNSYGGFIYLAFIGEPAIGIECEQSCMSVLSINLTIVFGVQILVGNLTEVFIPYVKYRIRLRIEKRNKLEGVNEEEEGTQAEMGLYLEQYDPIMGTLMDYAELAVQFGYITLFVVAFPLAPFLALVNNYVECRSDAFKLLTQMRRPVPRGAEDIGSWQGVFTMITCIGVVTNSALVCLIYEESVENYSLSTRLWIFVFLQWVAFSFMAGMGALVPDVPEDVTLQLERTEFISSKIIDRVPDITEDGKREVDEAALVNIKFAVSPIASRGGKGTPPEGHEDKDSDL